MAQRVQVLMISDLTGEDIPEGEGTTIHFSVYGVEYEMDVTSKQAQRFDADMDKYTGAARRVGGRKSSGRSAAKTDKDQLQAMREWGKNNGFKVSERGRLSQELQDAYHAAN